MDQASLHATEARCTQEHMPKCQLFCPLHMDVRAFLGHMADEKEAEARKIIERHLPLPQIFTHICDHPCQSHCLRRDLGGSIAIQSLESVCMQRTQKQGKGFLRPPKPKKVAVLGSGLAGLVVAYELAKKSWPVTIFYAVEEEGKAATVDSFLRAHFPKLTEEQVQSECTALQQRHTSFESASFTENFIESLGDTFAAIFIDVHAAPELFASLNAPVHPQTFHVKEHICAGGFLSKSPTGHEYVSSSAQAGQARQAVLSLERILGNISPEAGRESFTSKGALHTPLEGVSIVPAVLPQEDTYTAKEAQAEAARCIQCQCMQCVKKCVYLQKYGSFPRSYTRQIYNNAAIVQGERRANALVNGCMLCGQCTEICPERFSMAEVCLQAREDLVNRGHMPASAHAFALEDMLCAVQSPATLFITSSKALQTTSENQYAFFPGCQLTAARGDQVHKVYDFLQKHLEEEVGLMLSCCGTPAHWAGQSLLAAEVTHFLTAQWEKMNKPTLIVACASCKKFFAQMLPHIPCVSLWEILGGLAKHFSQPIRQQVCTVHDPCAARNDSAWQEATRYLATQCGVQYQESVNAKTHTSCCGYGGLVWCAQPKLAEDITVQLAQDLEQHTGLASCIMCRDRLVNSGKACLHLFDVLPFMAEDNDALAEMRESPSLSARRVNRVRLAQSLREQYSADAVIVSGNPELSAVVHVRSMNSQEQDPVEGHAFLHIDAKLLAELEAKHILHQDVAAAVRHIEQHKRCFLEQNSGHFVGAWQCGQVTFWVRYSQDTAGNYHLHDAWCHRMHVPNTVVKG